MLVMSLCAGWMTSWDASDATAAAENTSSAASRAARFFSVSMIGHPLRHRLGLVRLRVPRHEDEEREVHHREDARGVRVRRRRWLQSEIAEGEEADGERDQEAAIQPAAIADRLHRRAVEPRYE